MGFASKVLGASPLECRVLTSMELSPHAGPDIKAQVTSVSGKLVLACNMTGQYLPIQGHEWMHGDKVLQMDANTSVFTSYT